MKLPKQIIYSEDVLEFKGSESKTYARSTGPNSNKTFALHLTGTYIVECLITDFFIETTDLDFAVDKYNELP